jgi:hypothetical protein
MRPIPQMLTLSLLAACAESERPFEGPVVDVIGSLERADPNDADSAWTGSEVLRFFDANGVESCAAELMLDADSVEPEADCLSCTLALDVVREADSELDEGCDEAVELGLVAFPGALLAFSPVEGKVSGRVLLWDDEDESWSDYAGGFFEDGVLIYHRAVTVDLEDALGGEGRQQDDRYGGSDEVQRYATRDGIVVPAAGNWNRPRVPAP